MVLGVEKAGGVVKPSSRSERPTPGGVPGENTQMKFACPCGEVIRDQTDFLPHKAHLLPDQSLEKFEDELWLLVEQLRLKPVGSGQKALWDGMVRLRSLYLRALYQCPVCGRLNVDSLDHQRGYSFVPEEEGTPCNLLATSTRAARDDAPIP
ncbi:hypothetical protein [Deinococcus aquaedulcis]|uniref:hypothetical protein n=1 Tax=Deinococcus aquaedulcis TaxID=2840455 RepID=UPI001C83601D|nr:hypothetical protein [Deinococcus aquaedulcis]